MVFVYNLFSGVEWSGVEWVDGWGHGHLPTFLLEKEWRSEWQHPYLPYASRMTLDLLRSGGVVSWPPPSLFQKNGVNEVMTSTLLFLRGGGVWSWSSPSHLQTEGGEGALVSVAHGLPLLEGRR